MNRIDRLRKQLQQQDLDYCVVIPGENLFYLTGLNMHLSERVTAFFIAADPDQGDYGVVPGLEQPNMQDVLGDQFKFLSWTDDQGAEAGFRQLASTGILKQCRLGVEFTNLRTLEHTLISSYGEDVEFADVEPAISTLRMVKDESELEKMRQAGAISEKALRDVVTNFVRPGLTELDIHRQLRIKLIEYGSDATFGGIVCSGPRTANPHTSASQRVVQEGDLLLFDFGANVDGYYADITRTFAVGEVDSQFAEIHEIVSGANQKGVEAAKAGVACQEVDRAARQFIADAGYGEYFLHRTGHGLGLQVHERPYMVEGNDFRLKENITFTVEPGIYLAGKGGIRVEDDVVCTPGGGERLNTYSARWEDLIIPV